MQRQRCRRHRACHHERGELGNGHLPEHARRSKRDRRTAGRFATNRSRERSGCCRNVHGPTPSQPDDSDNGNATEAARNDAASTLSNGAPAEIPLIKDLPKTAPELGYERYAETLASAVCGGKTAVDNTPLTIGLFAPWGSGKSTLLKGLEQKIKDDLRHRSIVVNFNAWHHATSQNLAVDLLTTMGNEVTESQAKERPEQDGQAVGSAQKSALAKAGATLKSIAMVVANNTHIGFDLPFLKMNMDTTVGELLKTSPLAGATDDSEDDQAEKIAEQTGMTLEQAQVADSMLDEIEVNLSKADRRIVVMIDDLDRCAPSEIAQSIETISSLTGRKGMIFILAMDHDYIINAVQSHYEAQGSSVNGDKYLEKIIQIPFWIPLPEFSEEGSLAKLIGSDSWNALKGTWLDAELEGDVQKIVQNALRSNPRQTKRFINSFLLLSSMYWDGLHGAGKTAEDRKEFLYFLGLQIAWPTLHTHILSGLNLLDASDAQKPGSFSDLDIIKNILVTEDAEDSGDATRNATDIIKNLNRQYGLALSSAEDLRLLRSYLDDNEVFSKISAERAKSIMRMASTGMDTAPAKSSSPNMSNRDSSKWYWDGDTADKRAKWDVLRLIARRYREEPDNVVLSREEFEEKLGGELRRAVHATAAAKAPFDAHALFSPIDEKDNRASEYAITFDNDETKYNLGWWCGFKVKSIGVNVHRPVIEYFRDVKHYPIELA